MGRTTGYRLSCLLHQYISANDDNQRKELFLRGLMPDPSTFTVAWVEYIGSIAKSCSFHMYTQRSNLHILYGLGYCSRYVIPINIPIDQWQLQSSTPTTQFHVIIPRADWNGFEICPGSSRMSKLISADPSSTFYEGCKANYVKKYRLASEC